MADALHHKLLTDVADMMEVDSPEYNNFLEHMSLFVPKGVLKSKPNLLEKLGAMRNRGHLNRGHYDSLKKVARDSGNVDVLELIEATERELRKQHEAEILRSEQPGAGIADEDTYIKPGSKRRYQEADESDPLYGKDRFGRGTYDTKGKRGYLLIINYRRPGLGNDVKNLRSFFDTELGFELKVISGELTKDDMWTGLKDARTLLSEDTRRQYYAFFCVILSHGREMAIQTKDRQLIALEDIRVFFSNKNMANFTGRPKVFIIQSCQGAEAQGLHSVEDEDDSIADDTKVVDESDELFKIPTDADTMFALATTPGYASYGESCVKQVTWYIDTMLNVFKRLYKTDHMEDMMISVREALALGKEEYYDASRCKLTKQMPCTWSTLTKRLYLISFPVLPKGIADPQTKILKIV